MLCFKQSVTIDHEVSRWPLPSQFVDLFCLGADKNFSVNTVVESRERYVFEFHIFLGI